MQEKQSAWIFLELLVVVMTLGLLSAVAVPHASRMASGCNDVSMEAEFKNIQTAVRAMLHDSPGGAIEPVGPTADIGRVRTCDKPPLWLSDYFPTVDGGPDKLIYRYSFAADGTVNQIVP